MEQVEDDWTSCVDDIDRYTLSDNCVPLIPLSQLHRPENGEDQTAMMTDAPSEEYKQEQMTLIVQMVPAFGLKELSVYADPD